MEDFARLIISGEPVTPELVDGRLAPLVLLDVVGSGPQLPGLPLAAPMIQGPVRGAGCPDECGLGPPLEAFFVLIQRVLLVGREVLRFEAGQAERNLLWTFPALSTGHSDSEPVTQQPDT